MTESEFILACIKQDKAAQKQFFETYYKKLAFVALRYCKNATQADQALLNGFASVFSILHQYKSGSSSSLHEFVNEHFIHYVVNYVKSIRNEYYVASTVRAIENTDHSYDLFLDNYFIDFRTINQQTVLKSIQELVPSQRLVFNLQVIDGYSVTKISEWLDTNEQTLKSNLEKARFNLQKGIERNLKLSQYEQAV